MEYSPNKLAVKPKVEQFKMSRATRDIPFMKYASVHSELVRKGIY
jgi:hypothetical protein